MWPLISVCIEITVGVILLSQIIVPLLFNYPIFWIFKKKVDLPPEENISLADEVEQIKKVAEDAKRKVSKVKEKVDDHLRKAEDLKDQTDDLL